MPAITELSYMTWQLFNVINTSVDGIIRTNDKLKMDDLINFNNIIYKDEENSLLGSIQAIVKEFNKIDGVTTAALISLALKPILDTLSYFIDIVMKVAKGNYIVGYDSNRNGPQNG